MTKPTANGLLPKAYNLHRLGFKKTLIFLLLFATLFVTTSPAHAQTSPVFGLTPNSVFAPPGTEFNITVGVESGVAGVAHEEASLRRAGRALTRSPGRSNSVDHCRADEEVPVAVRLNAVLRQGFGRGAAEDAPVARAESRAVARASDRRRAAVLDCAGLVRARRAEGLPLPAQVDEHRKAVGRVLEVSGGLSG